MPMEGHTTFLTRSWLPQPGCRRARRTTASIIMVIARNHALCCVTTRIYLRQQRYRRHWRQTRFETRVFCNDLEPDQAKLWHVWLGHAVPLRAVKKLIFSTFILVDPLRGKFKASDALLRFIKQFDRQLDHIVRSGHTDGVTGFRRALDFLYVDGVKVPTITVHTLIHHPSDSYKTLLLPIPCRKEARKHRNENGADKDYWARATQTALRYLSHLYILTFSHTGQRLMPFVLPSV